MRYISILSFTISMILSYIATPMILNILLTSRNALSLNYKNSKIPVCMGILFVFIQILSIGFIIAPWESDNIYIVSYLLVLTLMGLVGLIDDLIGDKKIKGLSGHIKSFLMGNLTTGGIKAGIGFASSLFISVMVSETFIEIVINILIIALSTNLINLFDLRPGRAIKVFILISLIMMYTSAIKNYNFLLYSLYGILIIYLPLDLRGNTMMGDVGSNALGITLGTFCCFTHGLSIRCVYLLILIVIHIIGEVRSFSDIIENNRILNFIDGIGR